MSVHPTNFQPARAASSKTCPRGGLNTPKFRPSPWANLNQKTPGRADLSQSAQSQGGGRNPCGTNPPHPACPCVYPTTPRLFPNSFIPFLKPRFGSFLLIFHPACPRTRLFPRKKTNITRASCGSWGPLRSPGATFPLNIPSSSSLCLRSTPAWMEIGQRFQPGGLQGRHGGGFTLFCLVTGQELLQRHPPSPRLVLLG